jgi:hypothetical protein
VLRIALLNAVCDLPLPRWAGSRKRLCCEISGVYAGARKRTASHDQPFAEDCQWVFRGFHRFFAVFLGFCAILGTKWAILRGIIGGSGCVCGFGSGENELGENTVLRDVPRHGDRNPKVVVNKRNSDGAIWALQRQMTTSAGVPLDGLDLGAQYRTTAEAIGTIRQSE